MYVNGSRITSRYRQENKRLSMHMSKHSHLSGPFCMDKTTIDYLTILIICPSGL
jgi:hypothetical protein